MMYHPDGRHLFGTVRVDEQGQITLPEEACGIFAIQPGDALVVLGDKTKGMALVRVGTLCRKEREIPGHAREIPAEEGA